MEDPKTVTDAVNAGNYTQAISLASELMPGRQDILDALGVCQGIQNAQQMADKQALKVADGN